MGFLVWFVIWMICVCGGVTRKEHDERLRGVLSRLKSTGVTLNPSKCLFAQKQVRFLGHLVSSEGIKPDPRRIQGLRDFPSPTKVKELQSFLGMVKALGSLVLVCLV